jgi:hypothetical protein
MFVSIPFASGSFFARFSDEQLSLGVGGGVAIPFSPGEILQRVNR